MFEYQCRQTLRMWRAVRVQLPNMLREEYGMDINYHAYQAPQFRICIPCIPVHSGDIILIFDTAELFA